MIDITTEGEKHLKEYRYHGVDLSILARFLQPWWGFVVQRLPMWMAPNLVTLIGFFAMIFQYLLVLSYGPYFGGDLPDWIYFTVAGCVFFYQTMDAIDGKQARRTGCSSPLGELFDHGCDALTTSMMALTSCNVLQLGCTPRLLVGLACPLISFYTTQWEEHHTHKLILGYVNVTEAQLIVVAVNIAAGVMGGDWVGQSLVGGWSLSDAVFTMAALGTALTTLNNVATVVRLYIGQPVRLLRAFLQLVPLAQVIAVVLVWPRYSATDILHREWYYVHGFLLGSGTLVALLCGHLVVYRVVRQEFPVFHPVLLPTFIPLAIYLAGPAFHWLEGPFALFFGAYGLFFYFYESVRVTRQICAAFKISCFSIPEGGYEFNKKGK